MESHIENSSLYQGSWDFAMHTTTNWETLQCSLIPLANIEGEDAPALSSIATTSTILVEPSLKIRAHHRTAKITTMKTLSIQHVWNKYTIRNDKVKAKCLQTEHEYWH